MTELQPTDRSHLIDHHSKLRALAHHLVRSEDAEDYVQATYVTALSNEASPRSPGPWLRQVLRNKVRADARRGRRWNELEQLVPRGDGAERPDDHSAEAEIAVPGLVRDCPELARAPRTILVGGESGVLRFGAALCAPLAAASTLL